MTMNTNNKDRDNPCKVEPHCNDRFGYMKCPNMKSDGSTWDQDFYECKVCGKRYHTNDEDMK